jgi:CheY-like chemotaxis protein
LYEPFNRLGQERSGVQGTGIGLVLTRQLVRLMEGRMDIDSEVGQGTHVRVALPAHQAAEPDGSSSFMPSVRATLDGLTGNGASPAGVVLYIEDNPVNQLLVEQLLARWSAVRLVQAEDGTNGIDLARSLRPDLVLLDMQLPDMDGFAVLDALRADPATRDLRVIALSASAMPELVAQVFARGAADYWTKPLDFDRFLADMQGLLATQHS